MAARDKLVKTKVETDENGSAREKLQAHKRAKPKRVWFLREKMWISYLLSMLQKDRGKIPDNIGNKILITNNLYITKLYMSTIIQVTALSLDTPVTFISEIVEALRKEGSSAVVDVTIKNTEFEVKLKDSGLLSRIGLWENSMNNELIHDREKEVAARCLYTVDIAKEGRRMFKSRVFITLRAKTGSELTRAEKIVYKFLNSISAEYLPITANIKGMLGYISLISDYRDKTIKDVKAVINSEQTLSQMLPNSNSVNDPDGLYVGVNVLNNSKFKIDMEAITKARNIYIIAPSGVGKTVLALNIASSALERPNWAVCAVDIKGNEFTPLIQGTDGYRVSLRANATEYMNTWRMNKCDTTDEDAEMYFKARVAFSKTQLLILSGIEDQEKLNDLEELLDEFHEAMYISLSALPSNRNTWADTESLTPFTVYEMLLNYLTPTVQAKYSTVAKKVLTAYKMYMSKSGSKSYIFTREFDYSSILRSNSIMFDFGILEGAEDKADKTLFKLRFAYMRKLNSEFVTYKHSKGIRVLKILEESQIVSNDVMKGYVEDFTLRRSQLQTTLLLGNSVAALADNKISEPLIENTTALLIGDLNPTAREIVIEKFGLEDKRDLIRKIGMNADYENSFLFINKMQSKPLTPIIKVVLDRKKKYKLLTPVAQKNDLVT